YGGERRAQLLVADCARVELHAFVVFQQMRRGIRADSIASGAGYCSDNRYARTLAVGAADGDDAGAAEIERELRRHRGNTLKTQLDLARMMRLHPIQPLCERACGHF